jgi:glycosyltransferase involved in cell wall biosynthesis
LRAGIADAGRFHVVRSPISLADFQQAGGMPRPLARRLLGLPVEGPLIAYVGSLEERKGVRRLPIYLAALRALSQGAHLVIAGEGPLEHEMRAEFAALGLSDCVTFLGFTDAVPTVMCAADSLVLLSDAEGLPQVLVQAAAARRPFVAFPVDGAHELIWRGATASVVGGRDPVDAARATLPYLQPREIPPIDLREWSASAIRTAYRQVFDSQTEGMSEVTALRPSRHGIRFRHSVPA